MISSGKTRHKQKQMVQYLYSESLSDCGGRRQWKEIFLWIEQLLKLTLNAVISTKDVNCRLDMKCTLKILHADGGHRHVLNASDTLES